MTPIVPTLKRLPNGLLEGVEYRYMADGRIDWRAMIKEEYLAVQAEKVGEVEARYNKKVKDIDLHTLPDYYLIILLGGIKDLLRLRGARSVRQTSNYVSEIKAVSTCEIEFVPNFETDGQPFVFSDTASASVYSVSGVFQLHLEAIAANRAFVRAVRNALGIGIVGKDEFDSKASADYLARGGSSLLVSAAKPVEAAPEPDTALSSFEPSGILEMRCKALKVTFEALKTRAIETREGLAGDPTTWTGFDSVDRNDAYTLLHRIDETQSKKVKKAK